MLIVLVNYYSLSTPLLSVGARDRPRPVQSAADPAILRMATDLNLRHVTGWAAREPTTLISISSVNKQSAPAGHVVGYTPHCINALVFYRCSGTGTCLKLRPRHLETSQMASSRIIWNTNGRRDVTCLAGQTRRKTTKISYISGELNIVDNPTKCRFTYLTCSRHCCKLL